jgi:hypothetical protein
VKKCENGVVERAIFWVERSLGKRAESGGAKIFVRCGILLKQRELPNKSNPLRSTKLILYFIAKKISIFRPFP